MKRIIFFVLFLSLGCAQEEDSGDAIAASSRWMDRTIYFADPNLSDPQRNSFFQKQKVQDALNEIASGTDLGEGYFSYVQVPESEIEPIVTAATSVSFKTFILIWPDSVFNAFVEQKFGTGIPDQNAVTVLNAANKKQFYIIVRASCTETSATCGNITTDGFRALIARQLGFLVGLSKSCTNPQSVMCSTSPSDVQWLDINKEGFFNTFNNQLENILNTQGFYQ